MSLQPPGNLGRRLLPSLVDDIATTDPTRNIYSFTKTKDPADGFHDVSTREFAHAVDRCAWYIEEHIGRGVDFPTLLYMGPQDLVYAILVLACNKTGYKVLFSSTRNTLEAHLSLLDKLNCNTFLMPPVFPLPIVEEILNARKMKVLEIAGPLHWTDNDTPHKPYPYTKTWEEAALEPFVVLHTSGSTGFPKAVVVTNKSIAAHDAFTASHTIGYPEVFPTVCRGSRLYQAMPSFHMSGLYCQLMAPYWFGFTTVSGPFPPSPELVNAVHVHGNVQYSVQAPMMIAGLGANPEYLETLGKLKGLAFGGGPLPESVGNEITKRVQMWNCMGSTETGPLPIQQLDREDWMYSSCSSLMKHEYRQVSDDLYEFVIVRDPEHEVYQAAFGTFPELEEYSMKDLYSKHPTKADVWLYKGRADDIIVFSSGEKVNPLDMEGIISTHPDVNGVVVAGQGYVQCSLLIEAKEVPTSMESKNALLEKLRPTIEAANKASLPQGRVRLDMVIFTTCDKPMPRAGKGTIQRRPTTDLYEDELRDLYLTIEQPAKDASLQSRNGH